MTSAPTCTWAHMQLCSHPHMCASAPAHAYASPEPPLPVRLDSWEQWFLNLSAHCHHFLETLDKTPGTWLTQNPHTLVQRMILLASHALLSSTKHTERMLTKGWRGYLQERKTWLAASCWVLYISLLFGLFTTTLYESSVSTRTRDPSARKIPSSH